MKRMKNHIVSCIICITFICSISCIATADTIVPPEVPTAVEFSNKDINRIVCKGPMNDLIFSKEKGLTGHFKGNNAFMKFLIKDDNGEFIYADKPSELFVVCNNTVYSIIAIPKDIPTVTLRLSSPAEKAIKKNIRHYKNLPLEKKALKIIKEAYDGVYPSSYKVTEQRTLVELSDSFETTLMQDIDVEGVGLRLKSFRILSQKDGLKISEKTFLDPRISNAILAVAVEDHTLNKKQTTRVFVVEKREEK